MFALSAKLLTWKDSEQWELRFASLQCHSNVSTVCCRGASREPGRRCGNTPGRNQLWWGSSAVPGRVEEKSCQPALLGGVILGLIIGRAAWPPTKTGKIKLGTGFKETSSILDMSTLTCPLANQVRMKVSRVLSPLVHSRPWHFSS